MLETQKPLPRDFEIDFLSNVCLNFPLIVSSTEIDWQRRRSRGALEADAFRFYMRFGPTHERAEAGFAFSVTNCDRDSDCGNVGLNLFLSCVHCWA